MMRIAAFRERLGFGVGVRLMVLWAASACGTLGSGLAGSASEGGLEDADSGAPTDAFQAAPTPGNFADVIFPNATDYADVNVPVSFTEPVLIPPPKTAIEGDTTSLVGSWIELDSDGSPCTLATAMFNGTCLHLEIKEENGAVQGTIHGESRPTAVTNPPAVSGPFAPATNPNVGYPTTVSPGDYFNAEQFCAGVDYRLFDAVFSNGSFTFWFSPLDLWTDWCALQKPFEWRVGGEVNYRCVPQTADSSTTDLGKLVLCRSDSDGPECKDQNGFASPCACFDDAGAFTPSLPLCSSTVCECSASQCRAYVRTQARNGNLTLDAGKLAGTLELFVPFPRAPDVAFGKVSP